jgi:hypothetical protein
MKIARSFNSCHYPHLFWSRMSFPSARFISLEKSKKQGFWRQRQRHDLAPAQAIGLGLGKTDHPSPERAAQTKIATDS